MSMLNKVFAAMVTAGFLVMTAFEIHHDLIAREPWPGYGLAANNIVFVMVPFWLVGAASVWSRTWGLVGVIAGCFAAMVHGIGLRVGGSWIGAAFVGAAPVLLILTALARRANRATRARRAEGTRESAAVAR